MSAATATPAERVRNFLDARATMGGPVDHENIFIVWVGGVEHKLTTADLRALIEEQP